MRRPATNCERGAVLTLTDNHGATAKMYALQRHRQLFKLRLAKIVKHWEALQERRIVKRHVRSATPLIGNATVAVKRGNEGVGTQTCWGALGQACRARRGYLAIALGSQRQARGTCVGSVVRGSAEGRCGHFWRSELWRHKRTPPCLSKQ